ncbi:methyltransferase domain-containing protein, partial [Klebsiella variicola]|uniref:methyltransferase domain-containing protein n=1 Tax=Klebsiella variicola TaxID=244366 RepID=UPI003F746711
MTALELTSRILDQAKRHDAAKHYLQCDIESLPLPDGCVDQACSNLPVKWCDDLRAEIGELSRVVRPDWRLAITTL